jgi:hypothetical protein
MNVNIILTVSKDEPHDTKGRSYPRCTERLLMFGDVVQDTGPIFTGEDLVHS